MRFFFLLLRRSLVAIQSKIASPPRPLHLIIGFAIVMLPTLLIKEQPDLGTSILIASSLNEYDHAINHLSKSHELSDCTKERTSYLNRIEFCKKRLQLSKKYEQVLSF